MKTTRKKAANAEMAFRSEGISSSRNHLASSSKRIQGIYRGLLCYIHENQLKPGDLLPSHEQLRQQIKTGSITLNNAISMLVSDGVLERVRGTGTRLLRTDVVSLQTWTIGVPVFDNLTYGFRPMLEHYLRRSLLQNGCSDRSYLAHPGIKDIERLSTDDFAGLPEDIEAGQVDGIVTFRPLDSDKIPVCLAGSSSPGKMAVEIDDTGFVLDAVVELRKRGFQGIAIAGPENYNKKRKQFFKSAKIISKGLYWINQKTTGGIDAGHETVAAVLPLIKSEKVDAILTLDETAANTTMQVLRSSGIPLPALAIQVNKQLPTPLIGDNILRYELDIKELADMAIQLMVKKLLDPTASTKSKKIRPQLSQGYE